MVEIAALYPAQGIGQHAHRARGTVHRDAVDEGPVTHYPEHLAHQLAAVGEEPLVELVETVLAVEHHVEPIEADAQVLGDLRLPHVDVPGNRHPGHGQPEGQRQQAVHDEGFRTLEVVADLAQGVVHVGDLQHALEEVSEEHGFDGVPADDHRGNGQQDQRHGDHRRRLLEVLLGVLVTRSLAVEDQEVHAETVERRDEDARHQQPVGIGGTGDLRVAYRLDDGVLGEETGKAGESDQRQGAEQRRDPGDLHVLADAAHVADVLIVVHADDHRARRQEQQRLEEGVGHEVEQACCVGRCTQSGDHVTQLGKGGIGDDALDVVLHDTDEAHEEGGGGTYDEHEAQRRLGELIERRHACHHEDTGCHHGGGMDQRRDGRGAFHGIGQPHVQWHLRRLAHGADEEQDADHGHQRPLAVAPDVHRGGGLVGSRLEYLGIVEAAEVHGHCRDAENETEIPHPVHQEGLHVGVDGALALEVEADEQVGDQAHRLPAEEELEEVVGHHQHQHGEGEQGDVAEEALVALVVGHVADGVDVHHERDEGHHRDHHGREIVHQEADLHLQAIHHHPAVDGIVVNGRAVEDVLPEDIGGKGKGYSHAEDGHPVGARAPDLVAEQSRDQRAEEGRQYQGQVDALHVFHLPTPSDCSGRRR